MKVKGLDGREYSWSLSGYQHTPNQIRPRSELHLEARKILKEIYVSFPLLEEVYIPGPEKMYLDFFIPALMIAYEVQGRQHFEFVAHFHGDKMTFAKAKKKDRLKRDWLEINGIQLVELNYNEVEAWRGKILGVDA